MTYIMFPHSGSGNHGCEAIVRTTSAMLMGQHKTLFSFHEEEDRAYLPDTDLEIRSPEQAISRCSAGYWKAFFQAHIGGQADAFDVLHFSPVVSACGPDTVLLSIGGDNYCYGDNGHIYLVNRHARKRGAKTVLWGCSVEPDSISEEMARDLAGYDRIVARESITFEALKKLNPHTVLYPDPAFTLPVGQGKFPAGLGEKPYIGINVSPMIQSRETQPGITIENYVTLMEAILRDTDNDIALIPHVVWSHNDDRIPLTQLYQRFRDTGRVYLVEDQDCTRLKDIISRCRVFVGARTHATIAAYSTCVPTLVVGYSVKARGIAKDLFGTEEHYVIPVQGLSRPEDLSDAFGWIEAREENIRHHLQSIMPDYIARARDAAIKLIDL